MKKNRSTMLKRQRESEKRERQAKKAAKTALKRERRLQGKNDPPQQFEAPDAQEQGEIPNRVRNETARGGQSSPG